jgi:hypothetical protein
MASQTVHVREVWNGQYVASSHRTFVVVPHRHTNGRQRFMDRIMIQMRVDGGYTLVEGDWRAIVGLLAKKVTAPHTVRTQSFAGQQIDFACAGASTTVRLADRRDECNAGASDEFSCGVTNRRRTQSSALGCPRQGRESSGALPYPTVHGTSHESH